MTAHRRLLIILGSTLLILLIAGGIAFVMLNGRNQALPTAGAALESDATVTVSRAASQDWYVFAPAAGSATTGLILYPGGFVDPVAYALVAHDIARQGFLVVIDPMPLNLAVTHVEAADAIIDAFPGIDAWAVGGHSLGGAMAAQYVYDNPEAMAGLALWAAYPAEGIDLSGLPVNVVSIYGDKDGVAAIEEITGAASRLPADTQFVLVPGGNHTQFGEYGTGLQRGDSVAGIDRAEQRALVVAATVKLLHSIASPSPADQTEG